MADQKKSQVLDQEPDRISLAANAGASSHCRTVAGSRNSRGHSLIELLLVVALIGVLGSLALPQLIAERRLSRSVAVTREILSQLRYARQLAMSQRQAVTFQYDNTTKQISVIDHNSNPGPDLLIDPTYPNTANSQVVSAAPLATEPMLAAEITYGIPSLPAGALTNGKLADGIGMAALSANNQVNITFQPDGSVIDTAANPLGQAMFIYNSSAARATVSAISIMGASGRVKVWRYNAVANAFAE